MRCRSPTHPLVGCPRCTATRPTAETKYAAAHENIQRAVHNFVDLGQGWRAVVTGDRDGLSSESPGLLFAVHTSFLHLPRICSSVPRSRNSGAVNKDIADKHQSIGASPSRPCRRMWTRFGMGCSGVQATARLLNRRALALRRHPMRRTATPSATTAGDSRRPISH